MYEKLDIQELIEFTKTLKILYVEDNKEARVAFKNLLDNFFDHIVIAVDGSDGIEKFQKDKFNLIISDIRMPKMNGLEMIKQIRTIQKNIPIVVATAHKESDLLIECIQNSVDGYLLKPINYKQLHQSMVKICEKIYYIKKNQEYESSLEELVKSRTQELEQNQQKLLDMANKDPMTNLYNRRYFHDISVTLFKLAAREKSDLSVLMIDIDRFKTINDIYGHMIGDIVIKKLADILLDLTRHSDVVIRFGGEEFVILLPNTNTSGASLIATKIRKTIETLEIEIENHDILKFTISIGIGLCDHINDTNIDNSIHRADEALYEAKRSGRNKIAIYEKKIIEG
jgi:diguanylate cyclase (GGDEF)-like protein